MTSALKRYKTAEAHEMGLSRLLKEASEEGVLCIQRRDEDVALLVSIGEEGAVNTIMKLSEIVKELREIGGRAADVGDDLDQLADELRDRVSSEFQEDSTEKAPVG